MLLGGAGGVGAFENVRMNDGGLVSCALGLVGPEPFRSLWAAAP